MLKDIDFKKKLDVGIAVVEEDGAYNTYIINFRDEEIKTILITSKGYGQIDGRKKETTIFRRMIDTMKPQSL